MSEKDKHIVIDIRESHREQAIAEQLTISPVIHESAQEKILTVFEMLEVAKKDLDTILPNVSIIISSIMSAQPVTPENVPQSACP